MAYNETLTKHSQLTKRMGLLERAIINCRSDYHRKHLQRDLDACKRELEEFERKRCV